MSESSAPGTRSPASPAARRVKAQDPRPRWKWAGSALEPEPRYSFGGRERRLLTRMLLMSERHCRMQTKGRRTVAVWPTVEERHSLREERELIEHRLARWASDCWRTVVDVEGTPTPAQQRAGLVRVGKHVAGLRAAMSALDFASARRVPGFDETFRSIQSLELTLEGAVSSIVAGPGRPRAIWLPLAIEGLAEIWKAHGVPAERRNVTRTEMRFPSATVSYRERDGLGAYSGLFIDFVECATEWLFRQELPRSGRGDGRSQVPSRKALIEIIRRLPSELRRYNGDEDADELDALEDWGLGAER